MSNELTLFEPPRRDYSWATDAELLEALRNNLWHIGRTAEVFGVPRHAVRNRVNETPALKQAEDDFDQYIVDDAEFHLRRNATLGKESAVNSLLNAKGSDRGYGKQAKELAQGIEVVIRQLGSAAQKENG